MEASQIAKNLLSDTNAYYEFILKMVTNHLMNNPDEKIYWDAWFNGAVNKDLEDADKGVPYSK
jgi:hypothetical protein